MADDTLLNAGTGGDTIGTDEILGIKYQRVKLIEGADGVNDGDVSSANPLPVELPGTSEVDVTDEVGRLLGIIFGNKTHNASAPTTDHLAALTGVANAVAPTYIEGNEVLLSLDLAGAMRIVAAALPLPANAAIETGGNLATIAGKDFATQTTLASLLSGQLAAGHTVAQTSGPWQVDGPGGHDAAPSGNPNVLGAVTEDADDAAPGNRVTTEGRVGRLAQNGDGALYVIPSGPQQWSKHLDGSTAYADEAIHATPGAGLSLYVTDIVFSSGAATAINIFFEESTSTVLGPYYLEAVAGRGLVIQFQTPKKISVNTALTVTTSASIAQAIDVSGFIAPG